MKKLINGEMLTIDEAFAKHKGLMYKQINNYMQRAKRMGFTFKDVEQTAAIGFTEAYNRFDDSKGFKFSTYAIHNIMGVLDNEFVRNNAGVHYTISAKKLAFRYMREVKPMFKQEIQLDDIMNHLQIDYFKAYEVFSFLTNERYSSMDKSFSGKFGTFDRYETYGKDFDYSSINIAEIQRICTDKENEILSLILAGVERKDIPRILGVNPSSVFTRIQRMKNRIKEAGLHDGQSIFVKQYA